MPAASSRLSLGQRGVSLEGAWGRVNPFLAFPPHLREVIYTTHAIESINARLRKIRRDARALPGDDAAS